MSEESAALNRLAQNVYDGAVEVRDGLKSLGDQVAEIVFALPNQRELFAGMALAGLLANPDYDAPRSEIAANAVCHADALLKILYPDATPDPLDALRGLVAHLEGNPMFGVVAGEAEALAVAKAALAQAEGK